MDNNLNLKIGDKVIRNYNNSLPTSIGTVYKEMPPDAMQPHDTWIIAFCPDTDSFFVTNQRAFFWEFEEEFESEEAGIYYFEHQVQYFIDVEEKLMSGMFINDWNTDCVFLENTNRRYF